MDDPTFPFEPITIPLHNNSSISFKTPDEVDQWINHEQDAFKWLMDGGGVAGEQLAVLRKHYMTRFNDIRRRVSTNLKPIPPKKFSGINSFIP